jgi:nicotinate-nucleotide pyrophosphorylase (carboxylating)
MSFDGDAVLSAAGLKRELAIDIARRTLDEDLQWGPDITTRATIPAGQRGVADVVARQPGTIAGIPVAAAVVEVLAEDQHAGVEVTPAVSDGDRVAAGARVMTVAGPLRTLLTAERTLLNLLSQLSGVATLTAAWVDAVGDHDCQVRDTRKTVPGLRILQKYAVRCGGGVNHRMGLGDAALIKDNHVAAAGSVRAAYAAVRAMNPSISCEIESDLILLDNMDTDRMRQAVALAGGRVKLEASGGLTLDDAAAVAATGVDYIAIGELTHSAPVLDLGFDLRSR